MRRGRSMFAARAGQQPAARLRRWAAALHDRKPFPSTPSEIAALAREVRDANFRIETAEDGIHIYNREGHTSRRTLVAVSRSSASRATARTPSISAPN